MTIDSQPFRQVGIVKMTLGTGENSSDIEFRVLEKEGSRGTIVFLHQDEKVYRLYAPTAPESFSCLDASDSWQASKFEGYAMMSGTRPLVEWGQLARPCRQEGFFEGTQDGLFLSENGTTQSYYATTVVEESNDDWLTSKFFAEKLPPRPILLKVPNHKATAWSWLGAILVGLGLLGGLTGSSLAMTGVWWVAGWMAMFGGKNFISDSIGKAFWVHLMTYVLDVRFLHQEPKWEAAKFISILAGLFVFQRTGGRHYHIFAESAGQAGCLSYVIAVAVVSIKCMNEEANLFAWFSHYIASPPWGFLWPILWAVALVYQARDYAKVPMTLKGFTSMLTRLAEGLQGSAEQVIENASQLVQWADDLEDAIEISSHAGVRALADYAPEFKRLKTALEKLSQLEPGYPSAQLESDFAVLSQDLLGLRERFLLGQGDYKYLRISPYLRCLED